MVTLPKEFAALDKYPGYYWHTEEEALYSVKVFGSLKPLARRKFWNGTYLENIWGYSISRKGKKTFLSEETIRRILKKTAVVPIYPNES